MKQLIVLAFLMPQFAYADVKDEIRELSLEIRELLDSTRADRRDLHRVKEQLERSTEILRTARGGGGTDPRPRGPIVCTARDNDGVDPFVLAIRDFSSGSHIRLSGSVMKEDQCNTAKRSAKIDGRKVYYCGSRDGDAVNPWQLSASDTGGNNHLRLGVFKEFAECDQALNASFTHADGLAYCASRDNDGINPWSLHSYNAWENQVNRMETYSTFQECLNAN